MALAKALALAQTVHTLSSPHTEQACTELACGISTEAIYGCPVSFLVFECVMVCPCDCMPPLALRAPRRGFRLCVGTVPVDVWSAPLGATVERSGRVGSHGSGRVGSGSRSRRGSDIPVPAARRRVRGSRGVESRRETRVRHGRVSHRAHRRGCVAARH
jgi:hypothetical protein